MGFQLNHLSISLRQTKHYGKELLNHILEDKNIYDVQELWALKFKRSSVKVYDCSSSFLLFL